MHDIHSFPVHRIRIHFKKIYKNVVLRRKHLTWELLCIKFVTQPSPSKCILFLPKLRSWLIIVLQGTSSILLVSSWLPLHVLLPLPALPDMVYSLQQIQFKKSLGKKITIKQYYTKWPHREWFYDHVIIKYHMSTTCIAYQICFYNFFVLFCLLSPCSRSSLSLWKARQTQIISCRMSGHRELCDHALSKSNADHNFKRQIIDTCCSLSS